MPPRSWRIASVTAPDLQSGPPRTPRSVIVILLLLRNCVSDRAGATLPAPPLADSSVHQTSRTPSRWRADRMPEYTQARIEEVQP